MPLFFTNFHLRISVDAGKQVELNEAMQEKGIDFDFDRITPQDLEELLVHLNDLTVEVEGKEKVRVFCE